MRKLFWGTGIFAIAVVIAVGGALLYLRSARPAYDGVVTVAGLRGEVEIWRDSVGVPHIWATNLDDLYFAQGYVHAQDRLWQMELTRRVVEGRLAEVLGGRLLESDRFLRSLGLARAARAAVADLGAEQRSWLEAYAAGVNAWIAGHRGAFPPEFELLRIEPEPWEVEHSLMLEKIMAWDLASYQRSIDLFMAARRLGPERASYLAPDYPDWGVTILAGATGERGVDAGPIGGVPAPAAALLDALSVVRASNAWAISGARTVSGKPILANDMHLALTSPSLWYLTAQHAGEVDVAGLTLPGAPFVIAGHNRAIAWGLTNAYLDDVDLFIERVDPTDSTRYLTPTGSLPFEVVEDTIRVRGSGEPVIHRVRWTRHGPIIKEWGGPEGKELLALRWVGHENSRTWHAFPELNRATNWEEFVAAVRDFDNPHQNVVYADTAGRIGYHMGGRVPLRSGGRRPPILPVPGWTGEWEWEGYLPFDEHPQVVDPPEGFVVTANNRQAAGGIGDLISSAWEEPFRAERIRELVSSGDRFDAAAVHRQQLDIRDAMAARYRDLAVAAAERAGLGEAASLLRDWDLEAKTDSRAAALFYTWHGRLMVHAARSLYGTAGELDEGSDAEKALGLEEEGQRLWFPRDALTAVLERRAFAWVEGDGESAFDAAATLAIREADSIVGGRSWGELQVVEAVHPLSMVPGLGRLFGLNVGPNPLGGSPTTVNVAAKAEGENPRRVTHGASQRHVIDLGDIDGAGGYVIPTGQSGIPFSRHYRDQFDRWREGGLWSIPLDRGRAEARVVHRMTLKPR